jgi:hypothetical protein
MPRRSKVFICVLILVFIATGFLREFVFLNWNEQIRVTYYQSPDPHVHPAMQWLGAFSYDTLYWLKWPLTLIFSAIFTVLSVSVMQLLFSNRTYNRITLYSYTAIFLSSLILFCAGWLLGFYDALYPIARFLAGIIETPILLIILIASFLVHRRL